MPSFALHGLGVSGGIAIGRAQLVSHATLEVAHYTIPSSRVESEIARLEHAISEVRAELHGLRGMMSAGDAPAEFGAFLDVHAMILADPTLSEINKRAAFGYDAAAAASPLVRKVVRWLARFG